MDLSGLCARPVGTFPNAGGGASATITGYNQATGVLSGICPPNLLVVLSIAGTYSASTLANAAGQWSFATSGIGGQSIAVAAVPFGTVYVPGGPGSQAFTSPGSVSFVVPNYRTLIVEGNGGGGGGTNSTNAASSGTASTVSSLGLTANGGGSFNSTSAANGAGGSASGGDVNTSGGGGGTAGGSSPNGGASQPTAGANGNPPGGGGGSYNASISAGGGGGGYFKKTYTFGATGAPTPGTSISGIVASGGAGVGGGGNGAAGQIKFTWS